MNQRRKKRNKTRSWYVWHRYSGIFAALFVIVITISGIALNHTDALKLSSQHLSSSWFLDHYNVNEPKTIISFNVNGRSVTQAGDMLFTDERLVTTTNSQLLGAVPYSSFIIAAFNDSLLLIDQNGHLIETLGSLDNLPTQISRIGLSREHEAVFEASGQLFKLDNNLQVVSDPTKGQTWSHPQLLSDNQRLVVVDTYKSKIISLENLLLDLHSGRFFGQYGTLFFDFVGILLLFLAFSGLYIWLTQRKKHH
ncbi:MAG: hypothetical protein COB89_07570 [Piscirickettsiaceae bacterium]|nr:MAG: hypothetical protein COB89_07570 [Piscirickettsiaceae bacterium]